MERILSILLLVFITYTAGAQSLKGKITTQDGQPVPYSTVYITELRQGTTSNSKGDYEIRLPRGKYTVIYQSLGYEQVPVTVTISDGQLIKDIILPVQYYQIPEVRISASGEDPAYSIMRKAIGLAPYYLNNISYYKANVYLKGNLTIKKIPGLIRRTMEKEARKENGQGSESIMKEGETYMTESYNEIEFTSPDRYTQKVLSSRSTFPDEGNEISPMQYISASFYQPVIADMAISPLAPNAFSHYTFRYLGATPQGNYSISKIQVIPKRKSQQLFEGYIYIIEDLWCLQSIDLSNENLAGKIRVEQLYIPVQDEIWMPVSHKFEVNLSIIGFKADAGYTVSVKYGEVKPNLTLPRPDIITLRIPVEASAPATRTDTSKSKNRKQIDRILGKDELSNRDMVRLSRLMQKESEFSMPDSVRTNKELRENTTHIIEKDAGMKDSTYWAEIRPVPLTAMELKSISVSDSVKLVNSLKERKDTTIKESTGKDRESKFVSGLKHLGFGNSWSTKKGLGFSFGGFLDAKTLSFNTVDGFTYGLNFRINKTWKDKGSLGIYPDARWAFNRQALLWRVNSNYRIKGDKQSEIFLRTGMISQDIGNGGGINPFLNSVTSLFFELNYLKLYESDFITAGYRSNIRKGLKFDISATLEQRKILENSTSFSIINTSKVYTVNTPVNSYLEPGANPENQLRDQEHAAIRADLTWTPGERYWIEHGMKVPDDSERPVFKISWEHGINDFKAGGAKAKNYDLFRAEAGRKHDIGAFSEIRWRIRAGAYLDNRNLTFFDFFHFNPQPLPLLINDYEDSFMNPAYYSMSTPEAFAEAHVKYTTPYLILKLLPGLSNTLLRENISLSFLGSRHNPSYTELGYTLSEILLFGEAGVFAGFSDLNYKSFGFKVILKLN